MTTEAAIGREHAEQQMLAVVRELLVELGSHQTAQQVRLDASLERDLGLGSLERVELLVRAEGRCGRRLPDDFAQRAETVADWVGAIAGGASAAYASERQILRQPGDAPAPPADARTFGDVLSFHAEKHPERVQIHLLGEQGRQDISYGQLIERASLVAAGLRQAGLNPGETVAIMLPTSSDFFEAFFGVMLAGGIGVPIYPPTRANQIEEYVNRQVLILRNAGVRFLISFDQVKAASHLLGLKLPNLLGVTTVAALAERGRSARLPNDPPAGTFFIQYTSGSTGNPKGVVLSHANVLANVRGIGTAVQARPDDVVVSWLPLYHDMGLIGSWLFSVYHGFPITVMSPLAFLSRPERWLWALSDSGGTLCPAPNFSYELCARKIPEEALAGVDLRRWRIAINAGEPVLPDTLDRFAKRFSSYGFRPEAYVPCYGLAESSVALTFPPIDRRPVVDVIDRLVLEREGRAVPAGSSDAAVLRFVANGRALPGHEVRIVDDNGRELGERTQGRVQFRGPSKTSGYFQNPEATAEATMADGWMESGDLAYWADGEVFVTGRRKDCIIKAGHNIIPQEVEGAATEVSGVRRGCVAAFGSVDPATGTERLVVVAETRSQDAAELRRIEAEIVRAVDAQCGLPPDQVELVPPHAVPKTSSGKIRRQETRRLFEQGGLRGRTGSTWMQVVRLSLGSAGPWLRSVIVRGGEGLAEAFDWGGAWTVAVAAGLFVRLLPTRQMQVRAGFAVARRLLGVEPDAMDVRGRENLGEAKAAVLLVNRSGPHDMVALATALGANLVVADFRAVASLPSPAQFLLPGVVAPPVDTQRHPPGGTLTQRISQALEEGATVAVFADSAIGTAPVRSRFRLEAIQAAAQTGVAIHPVYLGQPGEPGRGNASPIQVAVGPPLRADSDDPRGLVQLRDRVRQHLGELSEAQ